MGRDHDRHRFDSNPVYYAIVAALVVPLGAYMTHVFNGYRASGEKR
jgi:hypothetical protein